MIWLLVMVIPGDIQRLAYYQDKQECRDAARQTEIAGVIGRDIVAFCVPLDDDADIVD